MRKLGLCAGIAAGAICMTPAAYAQVPVELEGEFSDYDHSTRTMSVMDIPVVVRGATVMESPTVERRDIGYGINKWFKSDKLPGRRERGFLGGTAILTGDDFFSAHDNAFYGVISHDVLAAMFGAVGGFVLLDPPESLQIYGCECALNASLSLLIDAFLSDTSPVDVMSFVTSNLPSISTSPTTLAPPLAISFVLPSIVAVTSPFSTRSNVCVDRL